MKAGEKIGKNKSKGTTLDDFLEEEGVLEDAEAVAIKRVIAYELRKAIRKEHISKAAMADMLHISRIVGKNYVSTMVKSKKAIINENYLC